MKPPPTCGLCLLLSLLIGFCALAPRAEVRIEPQPPAATTTVRR